MLIMLYKYIKVKVTAILNEKDEIGNAFSPNEAFTFIITELVKGSITSRDIDRISRYLA